ncbi:6-bladed beta-propeller [candidate division KSB1 bacterium]|nr:6-bladed beta-propeller [candidate division KSB1 bacterium]
MRERANKTTRRQFIKSGLLFGTAAILPTFSLKAQATTRKIQIISGLKNPNGIAVDAHGNIYVADAGNYCIKKFSQQGTLVRKIGHPGSSGNGLNFPQGVCVDDNGDIYVMDTNNGRIAVFNEAGDFLQSIGTIGGYPGAFYTPKSIKIKGDRIYAANTRNHIVYVFDKKSKQLLNSYGLLGDDPPNLQQGSTEYRFRLPTDVCISDDEMMYVVDSKHGKIKVLDSKGRFQFSFGKNGSGLGEFNFPEGIALDSNQNIYVCDTMNNRLQKFSGDGQFMDKIEQGFSRPTGIYIDENNTLHVVDSGNDAVKIFKWS